MNTDNLNIMNLLLGNLPQATDISLLGGSKPTDDTQNSGFDLIFDQMLMSSGETETGGEEIGSLGLIKDSYGEALLKSDNQSNLLETGKEILTKFDVANEKEILAVTNVSENPDKNVSTSDKIDTTDIINSLPHNAVTTSELKNNIVSNPFLNIDGKFKVQNWNISGDNLNLDLVSEQNPETVIKVTIPAKDIVEQLGNNITKLTSTLNKIPLDGQNVTAANQLKELLAKYDIKELHINVSEKSSEAVPNKNIVDVEIFAQNVGQEIILKSKLNKNAIQVKKESIDLKSLSLDNKSNKVGFESEQSKFVSVKQNMQSTPLNLTAKLDTIEKFNLFKQFVEPTNQQGQDAKTDNLSQLPDFIKSPAEMTLTKDKVDLRPVRFTLPDNINAQLKPNGKSVRINIEPNNLGPTRLNLIMHNDKLSAVVTVHSTQAKMTVEGSLDRLLDALNKANIQVDYIDVDVNQQNSYEQFSQQKSDLHKQQMYRSFSLSEYLANENSIIENITPRSVSYVNANGVNLTA